MAQLPAVQAALVSLNPDNGAIISIVGGLGRAEQIQSRHAGKRRQPGSNFKPFIYAAAFESGFTAVTIINDAPIVLDGGAGAKYGDPKTTTASFTARPACVGRSLNHAT